MQATKTKLRTQLKEKRLKLTDAEHTIKSRQISERLKNVIDWSVVKSVHFFEPIAELLEVDIIDFITYLEDNYPHLHLATPRKIEGQWRLVAARGDSLPDKFDVVLVPMLGFDPKTLHRIGYGGGYYDKFLTAQPQAKKIGACFEIGKVKDLPTEGHDFALDIVVSESSIYELGP